MPPETPKGTILGIEEELRIVLDPELPVKLHFAIITKAKKPVVQLLAVVTNPERVAAMKENVASFREAIKVGSFYPSPSPKISKPTCASGSTRFCPDGTMSPCRYDPDSY